MNDSNYLEIWSFIISCISLLITILSFIVACVSLWAMIKINKSTSKFANEQAKSEEKWWKQNLQLMKYLLYYTPEKSLKDDFKIVNKNATQFVSKEVVDESLKNILNDEENNNH